MNNLPILVMLNWFQQPLLLSHRQQEDAQWTLNQVQGDDQGLKA